MSGSTVVMTADQHIENMAISDGGTFSSACKPMVQLRGADSSTEYPADAPEYRMPGCRLSLDRLAVAQLKSGSRKSPEVIPRAGQGITPVVGLLQNEQDARRAVGPTALVSDTVRNGSRCQRTAIGAPVSEKPIQLVSHCHDGTFSEPLSSWRKVCAPWCNSSGHFIIGETGWLRGSSEISRPSPLGLNRRSG